MKYLLTGAMLLGLCGLACSCMAWDGFDADTADLVEIIPEVIPEPGATVDVRIYDTDETITCLVDSVTRNRHTIEVVVRRPDGTKKTLVMENK